MRVRTFSRGPAAHHRAARTLLPGTGIVLAGAISLLIWAMIAAIATLL